MLRFLRLAVLGSVLSGIALQGQEPASDSQGNQSQPDSRPSREVREFRGVFGTISEISASSLKLKRPDGSMATVQISSETQFRRERQPAKLSDFKVGDNVAVRGDSIGQDVWAARLVSSVFELE